MNVHRLVVNKHGRTFIQTAPGEDIQTQYGILPAKEIDAAADGDVIEATNGEQLIVHSPQFIDKYKRIKRDAQIITFKDAGIIIATAGINPETIVAEAGAGSGAMTALLATHAKEVHTYDISQHNLGVAAQNCEMLGKTNVHFMLYDITQGIPNGPVDTLILDMPEPWKVLDKLDNLKIGGYIVTYTPSVIQLQKVRHTAEEQGLLHVRTVEVTERHWQVREDAVRPTSRNTAFTAFLCFMRYMGPNFKHLQTRRKKTRTPEQLPEKEIMQSVFD